MSVVIPSLYQHAFQVCPIPICSVAEVLSEGGADRADHDSLDISQAILPSVPMNGDWHLLAAIWNCRQKNMSKEHHEKELWVLAGPDLLSPVCGNQKYLQMTEKGILLKLSGSEGMFTSALFLWTVEAVIMHDMPICDCKEISIPWCLDNVWSFHWAFALGILV